MKFLTKIGAIIAKVAGIALGLGPLIQQVVPGSGAIIGQVIDTSQKLSAAIITVEAIGQAATAPIPGAEKLKMAGPLVAQAILQSSAISGKRIANPALFAQGTTKVADGWADILNSLHEDSVETSKVEGL